MAETVRKNLGMVTAYAYAVSKGYTGTEEEFAELMASYADVAQDAEASAQAAAQSATTAEQKATQAAGSATNAAESAESAEASAQTAAGSSNSASLYAQNASASATNAAGSASSASTYAGNASASAQAAEGSANDAQASATQAAGSADDAEAAKDLVLGMNAVAETLPAGSQATASYSNGTLILGIPKGDTGEKGDPGDTNDAPLIYSSASGSVANFTDGADDLPMKSAVVSIGPIQEGEGDPSPDNVRPISGRTGLIVSHSGADTSIPTTISVNWQTEAGTVYGGTFDVVSGKLTIDRAKTTLNGTNTVGNVVVKDGFTNCRISGYTPAAKNYTTPSTKPNAVCSDAKAIAVYYAWQNQDISTANSFTVNGSYIGMSIPGSFADADAIKAYLATHNVDVCYEIATPTKIQLTPQEVRTLLGENNIWSDGGNTAVEYPADTKMYIDQKITEAIAAALA